MSSELDLHRPETSVAAPPDASSLGSVWRIVKGYILWSYERGSLHYDVMVTLILIFVFLSPYFINYNDKPVEHNPHPIGVAVIPDAQGRLIYQIDASAIRTSAGEDVSQQLLKIVEPISGAVSITKYEAVKDASGRVRSYKVWIEKE